MLANEASQTRSQEPPARLQLSRAALRHLALMLLLTPLLGGLRVLIDHVDQRTVNEPIVVREVVEVPRTEYVQIEVPVPTVIIVEVPARATQITEHTALPDPSIAPPSTSPTMDAMGSASVVPEGVVAEGVGDGEATAGQQPYTATLVTSVQVRSYRAEPSRQAFEPQPADGQTEPELLAETPPVETDEVAEAPASAVPPTPAQHALADFYAYTDRNWSLQGYSSADEMRDGLGNSTTGWLDKIRREADAEIDSAGEVAELGVLARGEVEFWPEPEPAALAQPTTDSAPSLDDFYAYTEQNWSVLGYSSAEEMRRSLDTN